MWDVKGNNVYTEKLIEQVKDEALPLQIIQYQTQTHSVTLKWSSF